MKHEVTFTVKYELPIPEDVLQFLDKYVDLGKDDIMEYITFLMILLSENYCAESCTVEVNQK